MPAIKIETDASAVPTAEAISRGSDCGAPKRVYIQKNDIIEHGASQGCSGCLAIVPGRRAVSDSDNCRHRLVTEIAKTQDGARHIHEAEDRKQQLLSDIGNRSGLEKVRLLAEKRGPVAIPEEGDIDPSVNPPTSKRFRA